MDDFSSYGASFAEGQQEPGGDSRRRRRATPAVGRPVLRRIRAQRRLAPLAMVATLLCTLLLVGIAWYGARGEAIIAAQARAQQDAQAARELLAGDGVTLSIVNGRLSRTGPGATPQTLNGDTAMVNHLRALLGEDVTLYQVSANAGALAPIASSGRRGVGVALTGPALAALLGHCGAAAQTDTACHQSYAGVTQQAGTDVVAGFAPLFATNGALVGAIAVTTPLNSVVLPSLQLMVVLLLVGLLISLLALLLSYWLFGAFSGKVIDSLSARLDDLAQVAASLERAAHRQAVQSQRQEFIARQIGQQAHTLNATIAIMEEGQSALHDVTGDIWAGLSQPGEALDAQAAIRLARQAAVMAARVGSGTEDAKLACRALVGLINQVIAEDRLLVEQGETTSMQAQDLRQAIEQVEIALGGRLVKRRSLAGLDPVAAHTRLTSRRLRNAASNSMRRMRQTSQHLGDQRLRRAAQATSEQDQRAAWDREALWQADRLDAFDTRITGAASQGGDRSLPPLDSNAGRPAQPGQHTSQQGAINANRSGQARQTPAQPPQPPQPPQSAKHPSGSSGRGRIPRGPGASAPGASGTFRRDGAWLTGGGDATGNNTPPLPGTHGSSGQQPRPPHPSEWLND